MTECSIVRLRRPFQIIEFSLLQMVPGDFKQEQKWNKSVPPQLDFFYTLIINHTTPTMIHASFECKYKLMDG